MLSASESSRDAARLTAPDVIVFAFTEKGKTTANGRVAMKSILTCLAGTVALLGSAPALSEAYVVPDASTPWEFSGTMTFSDGVLSIPCEAQIVFNGPNDRNDVFPPFDHSDVSDLSATIVLYGFYGICNGINLAPVLPGNITYSNGSFTFHDVHPNHPSSTCEGDLTAVLDEMASPPVLTVSGTMWSIYGSDFTLSGTAELSQPGSAGVSGPWDPDHNPSHY